MRIVEEILKTAKALVARKVPLTKGRIETFRKDFLIFMKNVKVVKNYSQAMHWRDVMSKWRERLDDYLYKYLMDELHNLRYRNEISDDDFKYWDNKIRKNTWSFMISVQVPIYESDDYYTEEDRYRDYERNLRKWDNRVRREARVAWDVLFDFVSWLEAANNKQISVPEPEDEKIDIEGFNVIFRGTDTLSNYGREIFPEKVEKIKEGFKRYRARASRVMPEVLKKKLPIMVDFRIQLDLGGEYRGNYVLIIASVIDNPNKFVHVLAHEMGHHLWRTNVSGDGRDFWYKFISGNYGELDLLDVVKKYSGQNLFFNEEMKKKDPLLFLQVNGLLYIPFLRGVFDDISKVDELVGKIDSGAIKRTVMVSKKPITDYSAKNPEEAFCEAIGVLVAYGASYVDEEVRDVLKRII